MTVVIDTSLLVAFLHQGEPRHAAAVGLMKEILSGAHGVPVSSDHVLDEGVTLLRKRPGRVEVSRRFIAMFVPREKQRPIVEMRPADQGQIDRALNLHITRYERGLSFTDCVLAVMAQDLGCAVASFDAGFDGIVPRLAPGPSQ